MASKTSEMTLDKAYGKIDGMAWKLNGVHGVLVVTNRNGLTEVEHHPSAHGRRSQAYKAIRAKLGDDYITTINNDETMGEIFAAVWQD